MIVLALDFILATSTTQSVVISTIARLYQLLFDIQYMLCLEDTKWMQHINYELKDTKGTQIFWLKHRMTYGNDKWMIYHVWMPLWGIIGIINT